MKTYEESETASHDTEITLGARSILGIFFALALICGVFFGFGYSLGRGGAAKASLATQAAAQNSTSAVSPIKTLVEPSTEAKPPAGAPLAPPPTLAATSGTVPAAALQTANASSSNAPASQNTVAATYPVHPSAEPTPASPAQAIMVQIAAVSRREDANALVSALNRLGYNASIHTDAQGKLLHVQIGPFATRDAAKAMRAKLLNDGYNAILK